MLWLPVLFLILALLCLLLAVFYTVFWQPALPHTTCVTPSDCPVGQVCQLGVCAATICTDSCPSNNLCLLDYCVAPRCLSGNDCQRGQACVSGQCVEVGNSCQSPADCQGLSCLNQVCAQCLTNASCPAGQGCFSGACRYPLPGETGPNLITYFSPAFEAGNVIAPPAYFCATSICGNGSEPILCSGTNSCPTSCPYCVNGYCRCTPGVLYEFCEHDGDCRSGRCRNGICGFTGGECLYNYQSTNPRPGACSATTPYCVEGICQENSLGAICGSDNLPATMCSDPVTLGATGTLGDNIGPFCINGRCQQESGQFNEQCTGPACAYINGQALQCGAAGAVDRCL